jgi:hypothetical protein
MAISKLYSNIGRLGTELAQQHYATTTDLDGVLPWSPTDADRQKLVALLGRSATREEEAVFESGYRESMLRLDGNAHTVRLNPVFVTELFAALGRHGVLVPPDGTPERLEVEMELSRLVDNLKRYIAERTPEPPPGRDEGEQAQQAAQV